MIISLLPVLVIFFISTRCTGCTHSEGCTRSPGSRLQNRLHRRIVKRKLHTLPVSLPGFTGSEMNNTRSPFNLKSSLNGALLRGGSRRARGLKLLMDRGEPA